WSDAWNRSVLAGGLIVASAGTRGLLDELDSAPPTATERDVRRVGFALGEWGGIGAVEQLARERSEGGPGLQGALLGALSSRPGEGVSAAPHPKVKLDFDPLPKAGGPGTNAPRTNGPRTNGPRTKRKGHRAGG